MTKNIEALAQFGEEKIAKQVWKRVDKITKIKDRYRRISGELKIRRLVADYLVLTNYYQKKYGLDFNDTTKCVRIDLAKMGYDPKEFNL